MKLKTLSILAFLAIGASAQTTVVHGRVYNTGPNAPLYKTTEMRTDVPMDVQTTKSLVVPTNNTNTMDNDAANVRMETERTDVQEGSMPAHPKYRDFNKETERTYDQKDRIESNYGEEIDREIIGKPASGRGD